jgi:prepilin-type N-terminal cleavage/methylation domain-containing protein
MIAMRALVQRGFTLIELLIAMAIFALLTLLAAPMYGEMVANTEVRNAAENILMGLRGAQSEAVHTNARTKFVMASDGWQIFLTNADGDDFDTIAWRSYQFSEGASRASMNPTSGTVIFNGFGQIIGNPDDTLQQVDVTTSAISNPHKLRVLVGTRNKATAMKLCDPNYATDDPVGCPEPIT